MPWLTLFLALGADGGTLRRSADFVQEAAALKRAGDYDAALAELSTCLEIDPRDADCMVALGSTLATRGSRFNDPLDNEQAVLAYLRFLDYAPADHRLIPRVKEIVGDGPRKPGYPVVPKHKPRTFVPKSKHDFMPARVTVKTKQTVNVPVATILQLTNDAPDVADAALSDAETLKVRGLKKGVANLRLTLDDGSWHALRIDVK